MTPWPLTLTGTNHQTFLLSNNFCSVGASTLKFREATFNPYVKYVNCISHLCLKTVSPELLALINHSFPQIRVLSNNRDCQPFNLCIRSVCSLSFSAKSSTKGNLQELHKTRQLPARLWREDGFRVSFLLLGWKEGWWWLGMWKPAAV